MSDVVTIRVGSEKFAVPVMQVRDVLRRQNATPVPLAPPAVAGLLNLRGRVVTAIDLRLRLGLAPQAAEGDAAHVVVENGGELYALAVDGVGDVLNVDERRLESVALALDARWRAVASAVYPAETGLIVLLDIARLLDIAPVRRAAS
ncbi:MAG TPA: chemotaxis protein CheW [Stellaceae bacterium]|jgi:purine-binding chemotaxis protein CheW